MSSFVGAIAIADLVKTTLGPKGQDKILQSMSNGSITITNDGATILGAITVDNPAAKVLINIAKTQDDEVGDGTTRYGRAWGWLFLFGAVPPCPLVLRRCPRHCPGCGDDGCSFLVLYHVWRACVSSLGGVAV